MGAGSVGRGGSVSPYGIVLGHAYAILDVREFSDRNGDHRLVQLQNPWCGGAVATMSPGLGRCSDLCGLVHACSGVERSGRVLGTIVIGNGGPRRRVCCFVRRWLAPKTVALRPYLEVERASLGRVTTTPLRLTAAGL